MPDAMMTVDGSGLYQFLTGKFVRIVLDADALRIENRVGDSLLAMPFHRIHAIEMGWPFLWRSLRVSAYGNDFSIKGLSKRDALRLAEAVRGRATAHGAAQAEAIAELDRLTTALLDGGRYVRRSAGDRQRAEIADLLDVMRGRIARSGLHIPSATALDRLEPLAGEDAFEHAREQANKRFVANRAGAVRSAAPGNELLTDEQVRAIATDEDVTLVLAGAGTGKTSVIVGKIAYLVRNESVSARDILVLAFNRKASREIQERLPGDLALAHISTFHAYGLNVIGKVEGKPSVSKLAGDSTKRDSAIGDFLDDMLNDPSQRPAVRDFIAYRRFPYRSPFSFNTLGEYYAYVKKYELRALSGDLVKSFEELAIANFLAMHGVTFRYEWPYEIPTTTSDRRQYMPDFYLPGHGIYIEHFALDEAGRAPEDWSDYERDCDWKRSIHSAHGTQLIETYSWQRKGGSLLSGLREALNKAGVKTNRIPVEDLIRALKEGTSISNLARLMGTFLDHVRSGALTADDLYERAKATGDPDRSRLFLDIFLHVQERYEQYLAEDHEIDFHDMIHLAVAHLRDGIWSSPYRYILVDEFQDISAGRMMLLEAMRRPDAAYFLVGDDWQSIYRFTGSDVSLVKSCGKYLGHTREKELSLAFRFGDKILQPSEEFVRKNPDQTQRYLKPGLNTEEQDHGITVVAMMGDGPTDWAAAGLRHALSDIAQKAGAGTVFKTDSVLVLGRYNSARDNLDAAKAEAKNLSVEFSTIHSAKGREADYAIVLDLNGGIRGFPSGIEDDPLLGMVLPDDSGYPDAEERRLFYVAMTRARKGCYLVTEPGNFSPFVNEILKHQAVVFESDEASRRSPSCPICGDSGRLLPTRSGGSLRCSNAPLCLLRVPRCIECGEGYAASSDNEFCNNEACGKPVPVCPRCGVGVLTEHAESFGIFMGCTEYRSNPPCEYTEFPERASQ